jgi:hypothetical protein
MLRAIRGDPALDVREFVVQRQSSGAAHELAVRPSPMQLVQLFGLNTGVLSPAVACLELWGG